MSIKVPYVIEVVPPAAVLLTELLGQVHAGATDHGALPTRIAMLYCKLDVGSEAVIVLTSTITLSFNNYLVSEALHMSPQLHILNIKMGAWS